MGSSARRTVLHITDKRSKERVRHGKKVFIVFAWLRG